MRAFFYQIDWELLVAKRLKPPWVPQLANGTDTSTLTLTLPTNN